MAEQKVRVTAPNLADAARDALKELKTHPGLKGRHLTTVRLTLTLIGPAPDKHGQLPLGTLIDSD